MLQRISGQICNKSSQHTYHTMTSTQIVWFSLKCLSFDFLQKLYGFFFYEDAVSTLHECGHWFWSLMSAYRTSFEYHSISYNIVLSSVHTKIYTTAPKCQLSCFLQMSYLWRRGEFYTSTFLQESSDSQFKKVITVTKFRTDALKYLQN